MIQVVPTITADNAHVYRSEIEKVAPFANRLHIDFADGQFAPTKLIRIEQAWWPEGKTIDFHIMYNKPSEHTETVVALKPDLAILHAESNDDIRGLLKHFSEVGIKPGLALLPDTQVDEQIELIRLSEHILVFGGKLGYHGGQALMSNSSKIGQIKQINPDAEISWDGGINPDNAKQLVDAGVEILNVGGYIQKSNAPQDAYDIIVRNANT